MYTSKQRGSFGYWFAHWCAYQMTALNLKVWKPRYLCHDLEKPWLMLWSRIFHRKDPYKWVQTWHRTHSNHHLQGYFHMLTTGIDPDGLPTVTERSGGLDIRAMLIDWECSRYTKKDSPYNAREFYYMISTNLPAPLRIEIERELGILGL